MMDQQTGQVRLFLLDSHDEARAALRRLLTVEGFEVAGESASLREAVSLVAQLEPAIVLADAQLPDASAADACKGLRASSPGVRVILLAPSGDSTVSVRGILAGADGCIARGADAESLVRAIRAVAAGSHIIDSETMQWLREKAGAAPASLRTQALSPQEKKIVPLVAEGMTNKQIGQVLGLSHKTVKNHLSNVFQKLQVSRRSQLAAIVAGSPAMQSS